MCLIVSKICRNKTTILQAFKVIKCNNNAEISKWWTKLLISLTYLNILLLNLIFLTKINLKNNKILPKVSEKYKII